MKVENYIVESGNWKCKSVIDTKLGKKDYRVIEAATLSFETIFGNGITEDIDLEVFSIVDQDGKDFFVDDMENCPDPSFGVLTKVYNIKDRKNSNKHYYMLTSDVFANAGLPYYVEMAHELEDEMERSKNKEFKMIMSVLFNKRPSK